MPDRETVIRHFQDAILASGSGNRWRFVRADIIEDALALLREQGPRVMTLNELTEIYVEFKGDDCPVRLINFDLAKIIMYAEDGICRLWTGKPNNEQREAVKWDEAD